MKFYEIFMKLFLGRKSIGCVCLQVESCSELSAILEAEKITEEIYGQNVYGRVAKIEEISVSEFMDTSVCMAA